MSGRDPDRPMTVVALAKLADDTREVVERAAAGESAVVVSEEGEAVAILMGVAAYAQLRLDCERLRLLALGELEAAAGDGHGLAEVLDDAFLLLSEN